MPAVKKLSLVPKPLKRELKTFLADRGWGDIVEATELLNGWLAEEGAPIRVGKTAVGKYAQLLKDQEEALEIATELMSTLGIEEELGMHKAIMHMIATQAVQMMMKTREAGGDLDPKQLAALAKMLNDLMSSAGKREQISAAERERIRREAVEEERAKQEAKLAAAEAAGAIDVVALHAAREVLGFEAAA